MHKIIKGGKTIALVDEPRFVKVNPASGAYIRCSAADAEKIAVGGEAYDKSEAMAVPVDGGEYIFEMEQAAKETSDINNIVFVTLAENETIDEVTASEHLNCFEEWQEHCAYVIGHIRKYEDNLYKCVQAHTSQGDWTPDVTASLWRKIGDPTEEWPEWSQPIGAHDAYMMGDKVSHNGQHWISQYDNNVQEPGVWGWEAVA